MNPKHLTLFLLFLLPFVASKPISQYSGFTTTKGLAFAFSGAGGRIAQQTALSQTLINGTYPKGTPLTPSFLSGVSSGALSMVGLNGALENRASGGKAGWTFGEWNDYVFNLQNNQVYRTGPRGVIDSLGNLDDGYLLNNEPLEATINRALVRLNYNKFGDLFLPSYITVVDQRTGFNVRLLSTDPLVSDLPLLDILLATTAIPVAFKARMIPQLTNNTLFIDGGVGIDYVPVIPLLNGGLDVTTIYAITPNKDPNTGDNGDNSGVEQNGIIRNALKAFEIQGNNLEIGALAILANSNATSFLYAATLNQTFSTLEFDQEVLQYDLAKAYGLKNAPVPITDEGLTAFDRKLPLYYKTNDPYVVGNVPLSSGASAMGGWEINIKLVIGFVVASMFL